MSAVTLAGFDGLDASPWNEPAKETEHCLSRLYTARGPLFCVLDAEHRHDPMDFRHGNGVTRWTTAEALASWNAPRCIVCDARLPHTDAAGYHAECAGRDRYTADELDDVEEVAA